MSSESAPITLTRFRSALADLPISSLYAKNTELLNSIAHMASSNAQLEDYAREHDDRECYEAVLENRQVMKRFEERIEAIKVEVIEVRGLPWRPIEGEQAKEPGEEAVQSETNGTSGPVLNGGDDAPVINGAVGLAQVNGPGNTSRAQNGDEEEGVFL